MEQLTQNLKSGEMKILEVPFPLLQSGYILVRNHYSVISAGTEGKTVKDARLGYVGKALARKDEVKKVIKTARTIGIAETYKIMMNKLDAPSALGYSCAGEVIAVAHDITEFKIGDKVACAGAGAVHAEVVAIPRNLCVKLSDDASMDGAALTTLGAIALQGIRQSDLKLGESCAVIGLGLLGQLTIQILQAAGVKCIGIDIDEKAVKRTREINNIDAFARNTEGIENSILELSNGQGVDAVIITAATSSTDPVDFAGEICRRKGKVIIVGSVPTGFKRTHYYKKELELKMSSSYGPGRYDRNYEENGIDYPYGYVRWTENRNMQAFTELLQEGKINAKQLITHIFDFKNAAKAYELILSKSEPFMAVLLKYDISKELKQKVSFAEHKAAAGEPSVGFIGAGSFAGNVLLPTLKGEAVLTGIATSKANNAANMASKYGFSYAAASADELFADKKINTIFIASRHNSHAEYVLKSLQANKNVFTEKPLCLHVEELEEIRNAQAASKGILMLGFNRRFAPLVVKVKETLNNLKTPLAINYRINAGAVAADHWTQDKRSGGGRILGEVCHFIDLCCFLTASKIKSLSANSINDAQKLDDTLIINLSFENGSIATVSYFSNGNKNLSKEHLEIFSGGQVTVIDDFKEMKVFGKSVRSASSKQDKGHKAEISAFTQAIKKGDLSPIPFEEIYHTMLATFKTEESVRLGGEMMLF